MQIANNVEERREKLETFALDILDQCQKKGFTLEEVQDLPKYFEEQARYAVARHKRNIEFMHIRKQPKED